MCGEEGCGGWLGGLEEVGLGGGGGRWPPLSPLAQAAEPASQNMPRMAEITKSIWGCSGDESGGPGMGWGGVERISWHLRVILLLVHVESVIVNIEEDAGEKFFFV